MVNAKEMGSLIIINSAIYSQIFSKDDFSKEDFTKTIKGKYDDKIVDVSLFSLGMIAKLYKKSFLLNKEVLMLSSKIDEYLKNSWIFPNDNPDNLITLCKDLLDINNLIINYSIDKVKALKYIADLEDKNDNELNDELYQIIINLENSNPKADSKADTFFNEFIRIAIECLIEVCNISYDVRFPVLKYNSLIKSVAADKCDYPEAGKDIDMINCITLTPIICKNYFEFKISFMEAKKNNFTKDILETIELEIKRLKALVEIINQYINNQITMEELIKIICESKLFKEFVKLIDE